MRKPIRLLLILMVGLGSAIMFQSCFRTRNPLGADNEIRVVADSTIWKQAESLLKEIFEKVESTPQPEKIFKIIKGNPGKFKRFKNIILLSTLNSEDEISESINSSLTPEARAKVESGNIIFVKKKEWADNQLLMFLIGQDLPSLLTKINEQKAEIFFQFNDFWNNVHQEFLYRYKEQLKVEMHLLRIYGWMIRVPVDYKLEVQSAGDRFVMFHRPYPLRWLSVFWIEATDPGLITRDWCITKRNEIGARFYENELVEEQFETVSAEEVIFLNRRAFKLKGLWKNEEKVAGGPFRMYCFYDEPTERIYFIDMHLFSPDLKKSKLHYFRQMEIIANTFRTNLEIKPEEVEK